MGENTTIQWTDATWNPVRGCSMAKGSELGGCLNCYAAAQAVRFAGDGGPFQGFARRTENGPRWTGKVELVEKHLTDPLHWKQPKLIFVNSMSDLFHEGLPDEAIDQVFAVMALASHHTFQTLTKRADRMADYFPAAFDRIDDLIDKLKPNARWNGNAHQAHKTLGMGSPLPNVWLGVSIEDFPTWDARVHLLKQTPAVVRFISYEPALADLGAVDMNGIDWLIIGGESGPGARPFDIAWARNTIAQCKDAGVACFVKQIGRYPNGSGFPDLDYRKRDKKGGEMTDWPADIRVREYPLVTPAAVPA